MKARMPSFFRVPEVRQFNYSPRYYDPEREAIAVRLKHRPRKKGPVRETELNIRSAYRNMRGSQISSKSNRQRLLRLALIAAGLAGLFYLFGQF